MSCFEKFFSGEVAVYAATKAEAARFIKAYMDTGVERLSGYQVKQATRGDIEFAYHFCGGQIGWASGGFDDLNRSWCQRHLDWRTWGYYIINPGAPYTSITVKEFFGDE